MVTVSGGARADKYLADLAKRLGKGKTLKVGFLEGATYPDGTPVALVAAIQNFGAPAKGIPPRPFFTNMVRDKSSEWGPALGPLIEGYDGDTGKALDALGMGIAGQLQQSIRDTNTPPLAPATVAKKGFEKPLIDTGHMFASVSHEVSE